MKSKTEAIIIGSMNLGEADKLVTFFPWNGASSRALPGTRGSPFAASARASRLSRTRLHVHEREHQELLRIESCDIISQPRAITGELNRMAAGSVILELVKEIAPEAERNPSAFLLLVHVLQLLNDGEDPSFLLKIFEIRFLSLLGYQPKLDHCLSCGGASNRPMIFSGLKGGVLCPDCMVSSGDSQVMLSPGAIGFYYQALRMEMDKVCRLKPSTEIMQELDRAFSTHTFHILGKRLKSTEFLRSVRSL